MASNMLGQEATPKQNLFKNTSIRNISWTKNSIPYFLKRVLWKLIRSPVYQLLGFHLIYRGWICRRWCTRCLWLNRVLFSVLLFLTQKKPIHYTREATGEVVFMFLTKRAQYSWLLSLPTYSRVETRVWPCGRQSKGPGPFSTTYLKTNVSFIMFFVI